MKASFKKTSPGSQCWQLPSHFPQHYFVHIQSLTAPKASSAVHCSTAISHMGMSRAEAPHRLHHFLMDFYTGTIRTGLSSTLLNWAACCRALDPLETLCLLHIKAKWPLTLRAQGGESGSKSPQSSPVLCRTQLCCLGQPWIIHISHKCPVFASDLSPAGIQKPSSLPSLPSFPYHPPCKSTTAFVLFQPSNTLIQGTTSMEQWKLEMLPPPTCNAWQHPRLSVHALAVLTHTLTLCFCLEVSLVSGKKQHVCLGGRR